MGTGVRPGLSRREQEKARKKIQRKADVYITLIDSFITGQPVRPQGYRKDVLVVSGNSRDAKAMKELLESMNPDFDGDYLIWTPSNYKAAQEQLNKIIPNLKTVEVAEDAKDAANLISDKPVEDEKAANKAWADKHRPSNVTPINARDS